MINLLLSLAAGFLVTLGFRLQFGWLPSSLMGGIAFLAAYIVLARRSFKVLQGITEQAYQLLSGATSPKEQKVRAEKAIKLLEGALGLQKQQFLVGAQVHGAIGQIKYMVKDYDGAQSHFSQAADRDYMSQALFGALYFQKKNFAEMEKKFETAIKHGRKEALMWAAYAWCLSQAREQEKAIKVLGRAVEANPSDERLKNCLTALQNDKRMKMKAFEPMWWSFGLETPVAPTMGGGRQVRFQRN